MDLEATAVSESPRILVIENESFRVQCCLDECHRRLICDIPHLHPCCTGSPDSLRGCIGLLSDVLSDCPWDTYLPSFMTQQLQSAQIAQKNERRCIHHPDVAKAAGLSRRTSDQGLRELEHRSSGYQEATPRVRSPGGGRNPLTDHDPTLLADLEALVEPTSRGDPESPLRWTCKRVRQRAVELQRQGHKVGRHKVAALLADLAYSLQGNRHTKAGTAHPDRHAQFAHINAQVAAFHKRGQPVVSVDTKKKALVGDCKNGGREWRPQGDPELVRTSDCADHTLGKGKPYGVDDQTANVGWVSVGVDHDTAAFAGERIQRWWTKRGACR